MSHTLTSGEDQQKPVNRLYEVKKCLCDTRSVRPCAHVRDQNVQFVRLGQFLSSCNGQRLHMWHTLNIWGRPTETSEPYLILTYISWFTALRKKV